MTHNDYDGSPPHLRNGTDMGLGMALGRLQATLDHQTPILVQINGNLQALPDRIASQLKTSSTTSAAGAPTTFDLSKTLDSFKGMLGALLPVLIVLGAIFKRINLPDWQGLLRSMSGG